MDTFILAAIAAMILWGFGDFLIEHATRKVGNLITLSFIGFFGAVVFAPKAIPQLAFVSGIDIIILTVLGVLHFGAGMLLFEAYRRGKLSVIEVLFQLELPLTIIFAVSMLKETVQLSTIIFVILVLTGSLLISKIYELRKSHFEKGWWLAIVAGIISAMANTTTAFAAKEISPILSVWFPWTIIFLIPLILLWKEYDHVITKVKSAKRLLLGAALFDTGAWISYSYALSGSNLSIIMGIAGGYCAIAAFLGFWINGDRLNRWQTIGAVISVIASIALAIVVG